MYVQNFRLKQLFFVKICNFLIFAALFFVQREYGNKMMRVVCVLYSSMDRSKETLTSSFYHDYH
jgi:hypothetical protein